MSVKEGGDPPPVMHISSVFRSLTDQNLKCPIVSPVARTFGPIEIYAQAVKDRFISYYSRTQQGNQTPSSFLRSPINVPTSFALSFWLAKQTTLYLHLPTSHLKRADQSALVFQLALLIINQSSSLTRNKAWLTPQTGKSESTCASLEF